MTWTIQERKIYGKEYYWKNKGKWKLWREKNPDKARTNARNSRLKKKLALMNFLCNGNICCQKCSFKDIRVLQFDHIKDDGYKRRKAPKNNSLEMWEYYKNPEKALGVFQILCANCNWIKKAENPNSYHNRWRK